ncbi:NAD-dependent epimerase/dehydratase family protein [Roseateles sp. BYS180W]|uniref:NAD-dependent epimerase/dehydratase family protein n=1 Tax=Roseateles rivi TaxID=3299028 RepID=A0ABW7FZ26_9BURK
MRPKPPNSHRRCEPSGAQAELLIVGCGDVGQRVLDLLPARWRVRVLSRSARTDLQREGLVVCRGDLDQPESLKRLAGLARRVLHLAPPPSQGQHDTRTRALLQTLSRAQRPVQLVYVSTTGVYGHAHGALLDETAAPAPTTARALRRVDAEQQVREWGRRHGVCVSVLRLPGIYAWDREGGHPRERLLRGTPVLCEADDVYTNHIHADDAARACARALWHGAPQRAYNVCDDTRLKMGDYFDLAADLCQLPRPPRISRSQAQETLGAMQLSFMSESRCLSNTRLKEELRLRLRYPTVAQGLLPPQG